MRSLRIAILAPLKVSSIGGAQRHVASVRAILTNLGHQVVLFSEDMPSEPSGVETLLARVLPSAKGAAFARRFSAFPHFKDFDLVLSFDLAGVGVKHPKHLRILAGSYVPFRNQALKPVAGLTAIKRKLWTTAFYLLEKAATQGKPALACSLGLREDLKAVGLPVREEVIFPPVPAPGALEGKAFAKHAAGLKGTGLCLMFAGRWEYAKGSDRLERLILALPAHWEVILAVPNPESVPDRVKRRCGFVGAIAPNAMPTFYRAADVTILPTRFEGSSVCLAESLLCNTPVLTTPTGSGKDLACHPLLKQCVVMAPDEPEALLAAVRQFEDKTFYAAAVVQGREFAERYYGLPVISKQWESLLKALLK